MYAVVGCSNCGALKVVEGRPKTTNCPSCGKRLQYKKLKKFITTDDPNEARQHRAQMLANRQGEAEAFANVDTFAEMETYTDEAMVSDEEYLEGSGLDATAITEAGEQATATRESMSKKDIVLAALAELDAPTEADVVEFAEQRGVSRGYVETALSRLVQAGDVSESRGVYRVL
ncbi:MULTISPECIES: DUF5817 domain-containing protein [unclassified Haladaptatus]|uniref:DUF5817 domain-containing protein n=1 Tax=unclassified Haladaptatus TaxID=2622732 RepID=UPI0023E8647E|nr:MULTISPECIES: DUF5817 domain-containing protein [unclassified Haladaptatus]